MSLVPEVFTSLGRSWCETTPIDRLAWLVAGGSVFGFLYLMWFKAD